MAIRIEVPEYNTAVEFPDDTPSAEIESVLAKNYPTKAPRLFTPPEPTSTIGIASPHDQQAAKTARTFVQEDIPNVASTAGARIGAGFESSVGGVMQKMGEEPEDSIFSPDAVRDIGPLHVDPRAIAAKGKELGNESRAIQDVVNQEKPLVTRPGKILGSTVESIGANLPAMAGTMVTGNPAIGLTAMGLQQFGQTYDEARSKGVSVEDATTDAAIQGGTEVATELLPFIQMAKFMKPGKLSTKMLHYYLEEVPGEHVATAVENATGKYFDAPNMTDQQRKDAAIKYLVSSEHGQDQIDTFFTTILQGAVMGGMAKTAKVGSDALNTLRDTDRITTIRNRLNGMRAKPAAVAVPDTGITNPEVSVDDAIAAANAEVSGSSWDHGTRETLLKNLGGSDQSAPAAELPPSSPRGSLNSADPRQVLADPMRREIEGMQLTADPFKDYPVNRSIIQPGASAPSAVSIITEPGYRQKDVIPNQPILNDEQTAVQDTFLKGGPALSREGIDDVLRNQNDPNLAGEIAQGRQEAEALRKSAEVGTAQQPNPNGAGSSPVTTVDAPAQPLPAPGAFSPDVQNLAHASDKALDSAYGYGLSSPGTFGAVANLSSASHALDLIKKGDTDIDSLAAAIHAGWAVTARTYPDQPVEKKAKRLELAATPYGSLPEEEKEKDRVAARAILEAYSKPETAPTAKIETPLSLVQQEFIRGKVKALSSIEAVQAKYGDQAAPVDRYARDFAAQHFTQAAKAEPAPAAGPKFVRGDSTKSFTAKGNEIESHYAVAEADDLVTSHTHDGTLNAKYPQEIQPRNREKVSSQLQIQQMSQALRPAQLGESAKVSSGSPFVGPDGVVESGNGRTLAIRHAYDTGKAGEYRNWLATAASKYGLSIEDIRRMKKPVLVRVRKTEVNRAEFAREANQAGMAAMSPAELAKADAARITPEHISSLNVGEDGNLLSSGNRPFVSQFLKGLGASEAAGLTDAAGLPTRQLADRMQAAIFTKAYNDPKLVSMMAEESDVDIKNIITALNAAAPSFARNDAKAVTGKLTDAIGMVREAKQRGLTLDDFLSQQDMFAGNRDADAETIARGIDTMKRSGRKMADAFRLLADAAGRNKDYASQENLLGDKAKTPGEIISDVFRPAAPQAQQQSLLDKKPETKAPAVETKQPASEPENGKSRIENELDALSDDDVANMISSAMASPTDRPAAKVEKVKRVKAAVVAGAKPRGAASLLADAAKEAGQGFADSLKALAASYGVDESKLSAFPAGFDADGYAKAKPHFLSAWEHYKAAGKGLVEFVQYLGEKLGRLIPGFESQLGYFFGEMRGKHSFESDMAEKNKPAGYQYPDQRPVLTLEGMADIVPADYMAKVAASLQLDETQDINNPEREQLREDTAEKLYGNGAKNKDYRADMILGLAASGKSSIANPLAKEYGSKILDSDDAKEMLPEFDNGNGANAVHEESSDIFNRAYQRALLAGDNLVLPLVGGSIKSLEKKLNELTAAGYEIHLHYVDLPMQKSVERLLSRYNETGRLMNPQLIVNNGLHPFKNYSIVKAKGGITHERSQTEQGREGGGQEERPIVRVGGMDGLGGLPRSGLEPGREGENQVKSSSDSAGGEGTERLAEGAADRPDGYRVESATLYNNDKPFGTPNIIVESQTNPTPKPQKKHVSVQVSAAEGGTGAGNDDSTRAGRPGAVERIEGQASDEPGGRTADDVAGERPTPVQKPVAAESGSSDAGATGPDAGESSGSTSGSGAGAPRSARNPADIRPPSHVTGSARNFTITNELEFDGIGAKSKFKNNVAAIRTLQTLEREGRPATPDEQATLARYVGWGGLPQAFDEKKKDWAKEYAELKDLLTPEQYETAVSSTQNAHYTAAEVVKGIWAGVQRLGFDRGNVLEPSMGTGNFFGLMPRELRSMSKMTGVEFDHITGMIAKHLYPQARVHAPLGFQELQIVPGSFDLAIGNPPFGDKGVFDPGSKTLSKFKIHGYFFAKSVDSLRPGGVLAMVVSKGFLDANDARGKAQRDYVAGKARLLGAIRLPDTAFAANAGTEVTTDIVFLQKLAPGEQGNSTDWNEMGAVQDPGTGADIAINKYFIAHPDMMLGDMTLGGKMWRAGSATLTARAGDNLGEKLQAAIQQLPQGIMIAKARTTQDLNNGAAASLKNVDSVRPYNYFTENGKLYQRMPDLNGDTQARELDHTGTTADRITGMVELRDAVRKQLALEAAEKSSDMAISHNRKVLNTLYDAYVKRFGNLNNDTNKRLFWDDADSPLVRSLEKSFDKGLSKDLAKKQGKDAREASAKKADIFTKRVLSPAMEVTKVESAPDALSASMNEKGRVDFPYMESIYGKDSEQITKELGDAIYEDPSAGWLPASEYLSGNVKAKLAEAINNAKTDPKYNRNVEALDRVQPEDVPAADIFVAPHAFWVPEEVYHQFAADVLKGTMAGGYSRATHSWNVRFTSGDNTLNTVKLGTSRMSATSIMSTLMANKQIAIYDPGPTNDSPRVLNAGETAAAQGKADELTELFQDWIWKNQDRRGKVVRKYNDLMNTTIDGKHDGSHMTFPGMSPTFHFRPHQKNAVYRSVQNGVALYDHVVGAGKTAVISATAMELRRLGLAKKPMITVPNHLVEQWAASFAKIYPQAKILAATKKDFKGDNRRQLFAKIATGDWDAVIIAHSSFKFIPVPPATQMEILAEQKSEILQALLEAKADSGKKLSVKKLQEAKDRIEAKIQALADMKKDDQLNFEEMGVDALFVDEAHEFKNLFYTTTMQNVAGLGDPTGSGRAFDMFIKTQYLMRRNGGKGVYFATGTPISNSLAEVFHMQRFLQYDELKARGLANFDAWASAFGLATSDWEQDAGGRYKQKTRFRKLVNLPELKQLWRQVTDTITNPDLIRDAEEQGKVFPLPKIEGGKPKNVVVERSPQQAEYIGVPREAFDEDGHVIVNTDTGMPIVSYDPGTIVFRMEHWLDEKKAGNTREMPLVITGDARKAGLDFRLIDENAPDWAGSKTNTAVNEIHEIWKENDHRKGTQLVFIDLSTPKAHKGQATAKLAETVPTYFVRDHGPLVHVAGKPVKLDAMPDREFFSFKKGKTVKLFERMTGLEVGEGGNVTEAKADAAAKIERIGAETLEGRLRRQEIPSDQIDEYMARWESEAADQDDNRDDSEEAKGPEISFDDLLADSGKSDFSVYDDIKAKLIAKGIPADQIAYIHDANTDAQKHDLFAKVNAGVVRVLLGSTAKMGAGTNVQKKLVGLHHLDAPWKPSDLAQREGRIVRQGNEFYYEDPAGFVVKIRRYATKQTYDSRMWEIIETKAKSIELFKTGGKELREIEDVSSESANAAEIKASAAGNPLMLEDLQMKNEIRKYEGMEKSWKRSRYDLEDKVHSVDTKGAYHYKRLADLEKAAVPLQPKNPEALGLKLGKVEYNTKEDYNPEEMFRVISRAFTTSLRDTRPVEVGTYRGADIQVSSGLTQSVRAELMSNGVRLGLTEYTLEDKFSAPGFITRLDNVVDGVTNDIRGAKSSIANLERDAESARKELAEPFKHADKLKALRDRHKQVIAALRSGRTSLEESPAQQAAVGSQFKLDKPALGTDADEVRNNLTYFTASMDNAPAWQVVQSESELPAAVQGEINSLDASGAVRGVFTDGKIYVVADNLNYADEAESVFLHEAVAHFGLRGLLGERFKPVLQQIAMVYGKKGLQAIADRYRLDLSKLADRMTAAEEKLAEMAEIGDRVGIVKRTIAIVRDWLRTHGFKVEWSDNDIKALLARARGYVERSESQATELFDGNHFAIAGPPGRADIPAETKVQKGWRKFQDKYNRVGHLQDFLKQQGLRLSELANASRGLYTMNGKVADQLSRFMDNEIQPLVKEAAKAKINLDDISDYLLMQHAAEANSAMQKLHNDPTRTAFGVDDAEAATELAAFQARPDFAALKSLADRFQAFSTQTADMLENNGIISPEMRGAWDNAYQHYVPLRGGESDTKPAGTGKGMRVNGKQQRRSGHERRDEHVIENIIKARESAIKTVEKNNVALSIAQLLHEAADDRIGTVGKPEKRRVFTSKTAYTVMFQGSPVASFTNEKDADHWTAQDRARTGKPLSDYVLNISSDPTVAWMTSPMLGPNEINAYVNGHQVRIQINDEVAAGALTNLGAEGLGTMLQIGKQINNYLSRAYTGYDPRFTIRNTFRDFTAGMVNLTGDYGATTAAKIALNYPKAVKEFMKARHDPTRSTWVDRYRKQGGSTGASWLSSLERLGEDVESMYQEQIGSIATYRSVYAEQIAQGRSAMAARAKALGRSGVAGFHKIPVLGHFLKMIETMNAVSENAFRVATFMTLVQAGKSEAEAGEAAKNSTINFDKRGELGAQVGALWLFFNPAMQGIQRTVFALSQSEHKHQAQAIVGSMALVGFMAAELARGMGGPDDDEWDKIPRSVKNRNLVIRTGEKTQITIPLPYEYGSFVGIGYALNDMAHGKADKRTALNLAGTIMDGMSPLGNPISDEGDIQPLSMMPTVAKMALAPSTNTNSFGNRIAPEKFSQAKPDSQNMWRGTKGSIYDAIASGMNEATGGTKYSAGAVDVSPEVLKYYTRTLLGGAATFIDQVVGLGIIGANGAQPDVAEVPMLSVLTRENSVRDTRRVFWDIAKDAKTAIDEFNAAKKARDFDTAASLKEQNSALIQVAGLAAQQAKLAKAKRDAVDAVRLDENMSFNEKREKTKELEEKESEIYDRLIKRFNQ